MLLALDTSTAHTGVALYDGTRVVAEQTWHSARQHTVELMPVVAGLLTLAGATVPDLKVVAVALGPGSFTGVRVGLATAKGLALAQDLPLIGIPTLDVVAYPHRGHPWPVVGVVQAGRDRVCWALYRPDEEPVPAGGGYRLSTPAELAEQVSHTGGPVLFAGELTPAIRTLLEQRLGLEMGRCLPPALAQRRAGCLAELAWRRWQDGQSDPVANLTPIYLRPLAG